MKNIVGQTPRKEDFFQRDFIINKIYRRLDSGSHLFLAAPRRTGKTSIMRFLEDHPKEGYQFVYIITESANTIEEFYQKVLEEIVKSDALGKLARKKERVSALIKNVLNRIERLKLPWLEVEMKKDEHESFLTAFDELIRAYDSEDPKLVVMIDEFPQTVENIKGHIGRDEAIRFLRICREQRQNAGRSIFFVYTGSIGLPSVVKKLTSTSVINDLNVVDVPPLTENEARQFTELLLDSYKIKFEPGVIDYLLERIKWLIPFHIQLAVQELIEVFENSGIPLTDESVDKAINQLLNIRNDIYFEHYYVRLRSAFPIESHYFFAINLLNFMAAKGELSQSEVVDLSADLNVGNDFEAILEALEYDGYFHFDALKKVFRFNSYLLQQWWNKKNPI